MRAVKSGFVALGLVASFISQNAHAEANCTFHYSPNIRDEIIVPALKRHSVNESDYGFYNYESPMIRHADGKVTIRLVSTKPVNGIWRMDEGAILIVLDACSLKVLNVSDEPGPPVVQK